MLGGINRVANFDVDGVVPPGDAVVGDGAAFLLRFFPATTDKAFDTKNGVFGVGDSLAFGELTHQQFIALGEGDDTGGGPGSF